MADFNNEKLCIPEIFNKFNSSASWRRIKNNWEVIKKIKESPVKNVEIIIVDDFSNDGSREFLSNLKDESIKVKFHNINKNFDEGRRLLLLPTIIIIIF